MGFADVCKTPPVGIPIPYTNVVLGCEAIPNVPNIIFVGGPVHNLNTINPMSHGDEAGSFGGVVSQMVCGPSRTITGAFTVIVAGAASARMSSSSLTNGQNTAGIRCCPSQLKIIILAG